MSARSLTAAWMRGVTPRASPRLMSAPPSMRRSTTFNRRFATAAHKGVRPAPTNQSDDWL